MDRNESDPSEADREIVLALTTQQSSAAVAGALSLGLLRAGAAFLPPLAAILEFGVGVYNARNERIRSVAEATARLVSTTFEELEQRTEEVTEKAAKERLEDTEATGVLFNYFEQAYREPIEARLPLIEHAAAAIVDVRLSVAAHARVERAIRELDPSDVLLLDRLDRTCGRVIGDKRYATVDGARYVVLVEAEEGDALVSAGCVRVSYPLPISPTDGTDSPARAQITRLGRDVLQVCRSFLTAHRKPFDAPGRQVHPGSRTEEAARVAIGANRELRDLLFAVSRRRRPRYDPPTWGGREPEANLQIPSGTAPGRLMIHATTLEERQRAVTLCASWQGDDAVEAELFGPQDDIELRITGPHDVLRWIAEDLEANWSGW